MKSLLVKYFGRSSHKFFFNFLTNSQVEEQVRGDGVEADADGEGQPAAGEQAGGGEEMFGGEGGEDKGDGRQECGHGAEGAGSQQGV